MDSAMIAKISKSLEYANEPERMTLTGLSVLFAGRHRTYAVTFQDGNWHCECDFFAQRGVCSHTRAVEKVLSKTGMTLAQAEPSVA